MKVAVVQVRFNEEEHDMLLARAEAAYHPMSTTIRLIIRDALGLPPPPLLIGRVRQGAENGAENGGVE